MNLAVRMREREAFINGVGLYYVYINICNLYKQYKYSIVPFTFVSLILVTLL